MEFFLFFLGVIGMTHIIVDAAIMQWLRDLFDKFLPEYLSKLIHCYQCSGFWCGMFCGWAAFTSISYWQIFLAGFAGSFLSNFSAIYMNYIEAKTLVNLIEDKKV